MVRSWPTAIALGLFATSASCDTDLFHSTNWAPDCGADCDPSTSTTVGVGAAGGGGSSSSSVASTGGGGAAGAGGACVTCADALSTGADEKTPFCAGSKDLYAGLGNVCCDPANANGCATPCADSLCAGASMTQACVDCAGIGCAATFAACQNDVAN
jgi:hypothetical protein